MTPAGEILRDEIRSRGPIRFRRFMEVALYDPVHGYYRRARDPFGVNGDFFTAEQLQPVFGRLMASAVRSMIGDGGTVVELGAGRGEMADHFGAWEYIPVDAGRGGMPEHFEGVVFANEFFDALPVDAVVKRGARFVQRLVDHSGGRFVWRDGEEVGEEVCAYLSAFGAPAEEGGTIEVNLEARRAIANVAAHLDRGRLLAIDYGYTSREIVRFPEGTLMSYRKHVAMEDVLDRPGEQDITAHVNFTALEAHAREAGFTETRLESMARLLLRIGERDNFEEALRADNEADARKQRMQLKTLLYGMGESFRVLSAAKNEKAPAEPGP